MSYFCFNSFFLKILYFGSTINCNAHVGLFQVLIFHFYDLFFVYRSSPEDYNCVAQQTKTCASNSRSTEKKTTSAIGALSCIQKTILHEFSSITQDIIHISSKSVFGYWATNMKLIL